MTKPIVEKVIWKKYLRNYFLWVDIMNERLPKSPTKGPSHCPIPSFEKVIEVYPGNGLSIFATNKDIDLMPGTHAHDTYELLITFSQVVHSRVDRKTITVEKNNIIAFNSEQEHGNAKRLSGCRFLSIEMEKEFLSQIARSIFGKSQIVFKNDVIVLSNDLKNLIHLFMQEFHNLQPGHQLILESLGSQIAVNLLRQVKSNLPVLLSERNYTEKENIKRAIDYLTEQYNQDFSLQDLARVANLSPYHFSRVFKHEVGKTPYEFLLDVKLEKARDLLKNSRKTITEICYSCGFNNLSHFTMVFKKKMGVSPSHYRKEILSF